MQVEFETSADDAVANPPKRTREQEFRIALLLLLVAVLIGLPGVVPALLLGYWWVGIMIGIVYYSVLSYFIRIYLRIIQSSDPHVEPVQIRVRLTPDFIEDETERRRGRFAWSHVVRVVCDDKFVVIYRDPQSPLIIPRRAFASPDELRRFGELAAEYRAQQKPGPAIGLYDDDFFGRWTRDAGLTVEYQNTPAEFADVRSRGATEAPWKNLTSRIGRNAFYLVLSLLMGCMAFSVQHPGFAAFALVASAAFWYVGVITLLFLWIEWRRKRETPANWLSRRTLFLSPRGVIGMTPYSISCADWPWFQRVVHNTAYVYLVDRDLQIDFMAPKKAFPTFGQAEHFAHEAIAWHAGSLSPAEEINEPDAHAAANLSGDENPFSSPNG